MKSLRFFLISASFMKEYDECQSPNHGCEHECINTLGKYSASVH